MKNIKFLLTLLVAAVAVTFTSCNENDWTPGAQDSAQSVYLSSETTTFIVDMESTSVEIPIFRNQAGEELTVSFLVADESGIFNVPTSVTFAAEDIQTVMTISYNTADMELGVNYPIDIQVRNEENKGNYGPSTLRITIGLPEPWNVGTGIYRDDFFCNMVDGLDAGYMAYIQVEQHAEQTNRIRIKDLFGREMIGSFYGGIPQFIQTDPETHYIEFDVTDPAAVVMVGGDETLSARFEIPVTSTGMACVIEENGPFVPLNIAHTGGPGVFANDIISFPEVQSFWLMDNDGSGFRMNLAGLFAIAMPGATFSDTSISAAYGGMKVAANNVDAKAIVDFTLGYDVDSYKFAVIDSEDTAVAEEVLAGILDGTLEEGVIESDAETTTWEIDAVPGLVTIVAVSYMDGEARENFIDSFYFPGMAGGELPEATLYVEAGSVVDITGNPEVEASYPSSTSLAILVQGIPSEIKTVMYAVLSGVPEGYDSMEIINGYAYDYTEGALSEITETAAESEDGIGYTILVFKNLSPNTTYNTFIYVDTIYGEYVFRNDHTTAEAPAAATYGAPELSTEKFVLMPRLIKDIVPYEGIFVREYTRKSVERLF